MERKNLRDFLTNEDEVRKFLERNDYLFYVGMVKPPRPGFMEFFTYIEHQHYPPSTERNDLLFMCVLQWKDIWWALFGVPLKDEKLIHAAADRHKMKVADGVPMVIVDGKAEIFPFSRYNVYTIENHSDHPVYLNDQTVNAVLQDVEEMMVDAMQRSHSVK